LLQLRVGHTFLNKHLHRVKRAESPSCACCHRENETIVHYLLYCPVHANARAEFNRVGGRDSGNIKKMLIRPKLLPALFQVIVRTGRFRTVFGELPVLLPLDTPTRLEHIAELNAVKVPAILFGPRVPRNIGPDWVPPV
ncbi:hypothetical protein C8R44DRAFT_917443, partial [Mycena epipterygia]